ncbi:MAG: hypothetical protein AAGP08_03240 [Pseudomonadota bacterium]
MMNRLVNRLFEAKLKNACEACLPRTHEEVLLEHQQSKRRAQEETQRHQRRFVP